MSQQNIENKNDMPEDNLIFSIGHCYRMPVEHDCVDRGKNETSKFVKTVNLQNCQQSTSENTERINNENTISQDPKDEHYSTSKNLETDSMNIKTELCQFR